MNINNQIIQMHRGDDETFEYTIYRGTYLSPEKRALVSGEYLYLGIMEPGQRWEDAVIRKKLSVDDMTDDDDVQIILSSSETENLHPGTYWYCIKSYLYDTTLSKYVITTEQQNTLISIY